MILTKDIDAKYVKIKEKSKILIANFYPVFNISVDIPT